MKNDWHVFLTRPITSPNAKASAAHYFEFGISLCGKQMKNDMDTAGKMDKQCKKCLSKLATK